MYEEAVAKKETGRCYGLTVLVEQALPKYEDWNVTI